LLGWGQPDWATEGVYAYWDTTTHDLLYLGLASDLPTRFAQHNGLKGHSGGNKTEEIAAYFGQREHLGFTVLLQSKAVAIWEEVAKLDPLLGAKASELIAVGEGQLIEMHRLVHGHWPPWNKTGGAKAGQRWATNASALLDILAGRRDSLFAARRSLRDLTPDLRARVFESTIHTSRMRVIMNAHDIGLVAADEKEAIEVITKSFMLRNGHLLQDLDASDEDIRHWIGELADPTVWQAEAAKWRGLVEEAMGTRPLTGRDRALADYLDSVVSEAVPRIHLAATRDLLSTGYLDDRPQLTAYR